MSTLAYWLRLFVWRLAKPTPCSYHHPMEDIARELKEYGKAVSENRDSAHFRKDNQDD